MKANGFVRKKLLFKILYKKFSFNPEMQGISKYVYHIASERVLNKSHLKIKRSHNAFKYRTSKNINKTESMSFERGFSLNYVCYNIIDI